MDSSLASDSNIKPKIMRLIFPNALDKDWRNEISSNIKNYAKGPIEVDCKGWSLTCKDIKYLEILCTKEDIKIISITSTNIESIISASSLGILSFLDIKNNLTAQKEDLEETFPRTVNTSKLYFHQGTLRSGERLEVEKDLLILGDVNPGAMVLAGGNVMIWGRLLGIAHAGKNGNLNSRITALQLRPVQLRIANKVARGPKEIPPKGLAEEAKVEDDLIVIKPARVK